MSTESRFMLDQFYISARARALVSGEALLAVESCACIDTICFFFVFF